MKKILLGLFIFTLPILLIGCGQKNVNQNVSNETILFVRSTCPHCNEVKEFINANDIKNKVQFEEKETSSSQENANLFVEKATSCGIPKNQQGVPLLFAEGKCYIGSIEVIDYFKKKANIQ